MNICVRHLIQNEIVVILCIKSSEHLANPFTKSLARDLVRSKFRGLGPKFLD